MKQNFVKTTKHNTIINIKNNLNSKIKGNTTKSKILKTALEMFSKNGYIGTSVNDIAKKAKLTKSLLYHHFENKESILINIINNYQEKIKDVIQNIIKNYKINNIDELFLRIQSTTQNFLKENRMIVKIILSESIMNKNFSLYLFKIFDDFNKFIHMQAGDLLKTKTSENEYSHLTEEFFFHFLPTLFFTAFTEYWSEYYKISQYNTRNIFLSLIKNKHQCVFDDINNKKV